MSRLTKEEVEDFVPSTRQIMSELFEYKCIEEELGINLVTLFEALKDGFYYRYSDQIWFANPDKEECGIEYYSYGKWSITWAGLNVAYIQDYGKTWALTKEELQ